MASLAGNLQTGSGNAPAPTRAQLASVAMGNALEFYDFLIFSFFAVQIGQTFFPATNPVNSLLAALAPDATNGTRLFRRVPFVSSDGSGLHREAQ